ARLTGWPLARYLKGFRARANSAHQNANSHQGRPYMLSPIPDSSFQRSAAAGQRGFTLIELMIVVAILAIIMAIAIPAYQDYTIRSQVTEGMNLAGGAKAAVWDYWSSHGAFPNNNEDAGLADPASIGGEYVSA